MRQLVVSKLRSPLVEEALLSWNSTNDNKRPPLEDQHQQSSWDAINTTRIVDSLNNSDDLREEDHLRLTNVVNKDSSYWLQPIPARQLGTHLDDAHFRLASGLRLGMPLFSEYKCKCREGVLVDIFGRHPLSCKAAAQSKENRHYLVNDIFKRAMGQAGFPCTMEPAHLAVTDNKRPDGLTNIPWWRGNI
jgi:hypothetical protein